MFVGFDVCGKSIGCLLGSSVVFELGCDVGCCVGELDVATDGNSEGTDEAARVGHSPSGGSAN